MQARTLHDSPGEGVAAVVVWHVALLLSCKQGRDAVQAHVLRRVVQRARPVVVQKRVVRAVLDQNLFLETARGRSQ